MTRVLVVEDDRPIAEGLATLLEHEGWTVHVAHDVAAAQGAIKGVDLVLLDWMLPDGQGVDLLRRWRHDGHDTPVIFLTARTETIDKVLGLELGADDYVTKPFEPRELVARVRARLRTAGTPSAPSASAAGVTMDLQRRTVTFEGDAVELAKMEFELLRLFVDNPGRVFTREEILNRVWGYDAYPTTRTVDTHVLQLRQKTRAELFETVRGVGYRLVEEPTKG